jgi:hypothetical protein
MTGMMQSVLNLFRNQGQQDQHSFSPARMHATFPTTPMEWPQQQIERASLKIGDDDSDEIVSPDVLGDETEDGNNIPFPTNHESPQRDAFRLMMRTEVGKSQGQPRVPTTRCVSIDDANGSG